MMCCLNHLANRCLGGRTLSPFFKKKFNFIVVAHCVISTYKDWSHHFGNVLKWKEGM